MRTGIRSGVAPRYLKHLVDENRKALGGHRLGHWSPIETWTPGLDLDLVDAQFRQSGGDGLCAKCRAAASKRLEAIEIAEGLRSNGNHRQ